MEGCFSLFRTPTGPYFHNCKFVFCAGYGDSVHVGCRDRGGYAASIVSLLNIRFHRIRLFNTCRDMMQQLHLKWCRCRCLQDRTRIRKGHRDRTGLSACRDEEKLDSQFSSRQAWQGQGDRDGTKILFEIRRRLTGLNMGGSTHCRIWQQLTTDGG